MNTIRLRATIAFRDWQKAGVSVYDTEVGRALSAGDLHSGSTFDVVILFDAESTNTMLRAWNEHRVYPVFALLDMRAHTADISAPADYEYRAKEGRDDL